jgi:hypothetical protein
MILAVNTFMSCLVTMVTIKSLVHFLSSVSSNEGVKVIFYMWHMPSKVIPLIHLTQRFTFSPSEGEPKGSLRSCSYRGMRTSNGNI